MKEHNEETLANYDTKGFLSEEPQMQEQTSPNEEYPMMMASSKSENSSQDTSYPLHFGFSAQGWEYFKIFFVDLFLSIITLGIYSAWAKVRQKQYFYGNTRLGGSSFEYHAKPKQILLGRIFLVALIVVYSIIISLIPWLQFFEGVLILLFVSIISVKAIRFNMTNSSFRNVHFNFKGGIGEAFVNFFIFPLLVGLSLGLLFPYMEYRRYKFLTDQKQFGSQNFSFSTNVKSFYKIALKSLLVSLVIGIVFVLAIMLVTGFSDESALTRGVAPLIIGLVSLFGVLFAYSYYSTHITNHLYNNTTLNSLRFKSQLACWELFKVYASNTLFTLLTFGFYYPFAKVKLVAYRLGALTVLANSLDDFEGSINKEKKAFAEESGEFFDMDVGI